MTDMTGIASLPPGERRLAGITRILLGFVIGALFALLPMYYFYMGREAALRGTPAAHSETPAGAPVQPAMANGAGKPFASRLTYELSQLPDDRSPVAPRAAAPSLTRPAMVAAPVSFEDAESSERVANARPISAVPPPPKDRTREIEKEASKREPREQAKGTPAPASGAARMNEARDTEVKGAKLSETPTRPILAGATGNMRAEIEAERSVPTVAPGSKKASPAGDAAAKKAGPSAGAATSKGNTLAESGPKIVEPKTVLALMTPAAADGEPAKEVSSKVPTAANGSVDARFEATREWLAGAPPTTHTIQLMGSGSEEHVRSQLKALEKVLEPGKLYVFRTKAQGKPSITVVYGAFSDRQAALQALEKLPASVAANKPVVRTVNGIRTEIKQNGPQG
jgi:hypothetical protein